MKVPVYKSPPSTAAVMTRGQTKKEAEGEETLKVSQALVGDLNPKQVEKLQNEDETLRNVREKVKSKTEVKTKDGKLTFVEKKKLIYRVFETESGRYTQLVVPTPLRKEVMRLGHESAMAGHMGAKRTQSRIWQTFYWPGMCADIRRYVGSNLRYLNSFL